MTRPHACLPLLLLASPAGAWNDHAPLTRPALSAMAELDAEVEAEPLSDYAAAAGFGDEAGFLRALELSPRTRVEFHAGEGPGRPLSLRRILETYSNEPDWGMDQDLFADYPHLWKDAYAYMGGRLPGTPSQSFRHMHWPAGFLKLPPGGGEPVLDPTPLGQAPERAALFLEQARAAFRLGHPYWGARLLAWSLHYVQDVSQPYHAVQLPSPQMLYRRPGAGVDIEVTARVLAYYHFAFELLAARLVSGSDEVSRTLQNALAVGSSPNKTDAGELAREESHVSGGRGAAAGRVSLLLFPGVEDPERLDPGRTLSDPQWAAELGRRRSERPELFDEYLALLAACLGRAGGASRALASAAFAPQGMPAAEPALGSRLQGALERYFQAAPAFDHAR